jgi:riboflavin synthase
MFTGIIQDIGVIESIVHFDDNSMQLGLSTSLGEEHLALGASVACNGCCLTVTKKNGNIFYVDLGPKTLALTNFSLLKNGDKINLEPALRVGDAMGGHQVTGHIDGSFDIHSFTKYNEEFWKLSILIPKQFSNFIIAKGSMAICGISLTIADISSFSNHYLSVDFMIIPHTFNSTNLRYISAEKYKVEVEFDHMVKTIASLFQGMINNYTQMKQ